MTGQPYGCRDSVVDPTSIGDLIERAASRWPSAEAVVARSGRLTYAELRERVRRAASALRGSGVGVGDRVAVSLPNDIEAVVVFLAIAQLGAIWVGVNLSLAKPEKEYILDDSSPSLVIAVPAVVEQLGDCFRGVSILSVDGQWRELVASADETTTSATTTLDAPVAIAYTSGTTGLPKGVVHTHRNLTVPAAVMGESLSLSPGHRWGVCLSLNVLNLQIQVVQTMLCGGTAVVMDRVDGQGVSEWIQAEHVQWIGLVPAIMHTIAFSDSISASCFTSLEGVVVGGADVPSAIVEPLKAKLGLSPTVIYGLTELPYVGTVRNPSDADEAQPGDVGLPLAHLDIAVMDDQDRLLGDGLTGEICFRPTERGPWADKFGRMAGYWGRAREVEVPILHGWLHTGDMGFIDPNGHLVIRDRKKAMIIRGGANVYPAEVERVLALDDRLRAYAVTGRPDVRLGERVIAVVEAPGQSPSVLGAELNDLCHRHLAKYKCPDDFVFVDEIPRNSMGKVHRARLAAIAAAPRGEAGDITFT